MPKAKNDLEYKICVSALRLASTRDWRDLTFEQIAKAARIPVAQAAKHFSGKNEILPAIVRTVTAETIDAIPKPGKRVTAHDRLFEVMMARFDILQKHRKAILSVMEESFRDSKMTCVLLPAQMQAMRETLTFSELAHRGMYQQMATAGLWVVYVATLRVWRYDETIDMTKTMAVLDRNLRLAEKVSDIIFRIKKS